MAKKISLSKIAAAKQVKIGYGVSKDGLSVIFFDVDLASGAKLRPWGIDLAHARKLVQILEEKIGLADQRSKPLN